MQDSQMRTGYGQQKPTLNMDSATRWGAPSTAAVAEPKAVDKKFGSEGAESAVLYYFGFPNAH